MSKEGRSNINAVGLFCDILTSIEKRVRGEAQKAGMAALLTLLSNDMQAFVENVSDKLDETFGGEE